MKKKRKPMKSPAGQPRLATPQGMQGPDMALGILRVALMRQCGDFAREMGVVLRQINTLGEQLSGFVRRVPDMPEADVRRAMEDIARAKLGLMALSRLGGFIGEATTDAPSTPAPGTERKQ